MQQGASPFQMTQIQQRGVGLDPNAAATSAGFAQNVFGTQADMFGKQKGPLDTALQLAQGFQAVGTGFGGSRGFKTG